MLTLSISSTQAKLCQRVEYPHDQHGPKQCKFRGEWAGRHLRDFEGEESATPLEANKRLRWVLPQVRALLLQREQGPIWNREWDRGNHRPDRVLWETGGSIRSGRSDAQRKLPRRANVGPKWHGAPAEKRREQHRLAAKLREEEARGEESELHLWPQKQNE